MAAWLVAGSPIYRCRVYGNGWNRITSTGARDEETALEVEQFAALLKARRRWDILDAILAKKITLADAYDADVRGDLDGVLKTVNDVDLSPLVDEWAKTVNAKYVKQVRRLIPEGCRIPRSTFTKGVVSAFLAGLDASGPTKNRYRAALSVFAGWLVERDILEHNPVRDVRGYKEHDPRDQWMTWSDAQKVAERAPEPYRTIILLMAGTGLEWGVVERLRASDVDLKEGTIHARGSKTRWRNRIVRAEPFVWVALRRHLDGRIGPALVFDNVDERVSLFALRDACEAAKIGAHRLHDLRHTYAVNALKAGYKPQVVAHQLGHKDATMVLKVYGRYIPDQNDYLLPRVEKRGRR
jgi:integrase